MRRSILSHFKKVDLTLYTFLKESGFRATVESKSPRTYFSSLVRSIIGQQLSGKAADSIFKKFQTLFPRGKITPQALLLIDVPTLRTVGLSQAKALSLKDLAEKAHSNELTLKKLHTLSDIEVRSQLTKVRGIGPWTVEMFQMFTLGNENLFSYGDLGLQNGFKHLYKKKILTQKDMEKVVNRWVPYKTYGALALWHAIDTQKKVARTKK